MYPATSVLTRLFDIIDKTVAERKSTVEKEFGTSFIPKVLANHIIMSQALTSAELLKSNISILVTALPYTDVAVFLEAPRGGPRTNSPQISFITAPDGHLPEPLMLDRLHRAHLVTPDISAGQGIIVHVIDNLMAPPMDQFSKSYSTRPEDLDPRKVANIRDALTPVTGKAPLPSTSD